MTNVPSSYTTLVQQMSKATGIPASVVAAQANEESGFNANAVSSAGAEGWLQFLPSTYDSYAAQAGVASGTEFNPADEAKVYDVFMSALLRQEHGNLRDALAAYNAGPGNIGAGMGYADTILSNAGTGNVTVPGNGTPGGGTSTTGLTNTTPFPGGGADPLNWPFMAVGGAVNATAQGITSATSSLGEAFLKALGVSSVKDLFVRGGLILLGGIIVIFGIYSLISMQGKEAAQILVMGETGGAGAIAKRGAQKVRGS